MSRNFRDLGKLVEIQTDKGIVFSIEHFGTSMEKWTYFFNGGIREAYGAYVSKRQAVLLRRCYVELNKVHYNKETLEYRGKLGRLIRMGRDFRYEGEENPEKNQGYALILAFRKKEGTSDMRIHKIVRRELKI